MSLNISEVYVVTSCWKTVCCWKLYFLVSLWGCRGTSKEEKMPLTPGKQGPHIVQEEINQPRGQRDRTHPSGDRKTIMLSWFSLGRLFTFSCVYGSWESQTQSWSGSSRIPSCHAGLRATSFHFQLLNALYCFLAYFLAISFVFLIDPRPWGRAFVIYFYSPHSAWSRVEHTLYCSVLGLKMPFPHSGVMMME